ncbi:MAG: hypothetical protein V3U80_01360 [Flavobacteriaceae bacterium]
MTKYIALFITFLAFNIGVEYLNDSSQQINIKENNALIITDSLYNLKIEVKKTEDNIFNLVISVDLKNGGYYVSPNTKKDYKGKFYTDFGSYKDVSFKGELQENKLEKSTTDPFPNVEDPENNVFENAIFTQELNLKTTDEFFVMGRIQFVIEPRCTMEQIPFMITFKNGKMIVTEAKC